MKLISLNLWGGQQDKILFDYLKKQSETADIFCFQEVFSSSAGVGLYGRVHTDLLRDLQVILPGFAVYYEPAYSGWVDTEKVNFEVSAGQAVFVKSGLQVTESGSIYVYGNQQTEIAPDFTNEPKNLQWIKVGSLNKEFLLANAHGKWYPGEKLDTPERLKQSEVIVGFLDGFAGPKILCGDFNLMPETQSVRMLERGLRNLITDYKISNTRNEISWAKHHNRQSFADYAFVSPDVNVKNFMVPYNLVSDHLPMVLEFEL